MTRRQFTKILGAALLFGVGTAWKIKAESVSRARAKPQIEILSEFLRKEGGTSESDAMSSCQFQIKRLRIGWIRRNFLARAVLDRMPTGWLVAFLPLVEYKSSAQWMPPDAQSGAGLAMQTALAGELNCALRGREQTQ